jgi:uncharacterized RDD family membrane protein YckC
MRRNDSAATSVAARAESTAGPTAPNPAPRATGITTVGPMAAGGGARNLALLAIIVAMAEERHRPRPLSWIATKGVEQINIDEVVEGIDINAIVARLDLDALLEDLDLNALMARIDINALMDRVDANALLARVDPNALLDRVEPNALLDRVDPDRLLDRVDVDRVMDRVDVPGLVEKAGIADIVAESTGAMAGSVLDVARRQLVAIDLIVERPIYRLSGRDPRKRPAGPPQIVEKHPLIKEGRGQVTGRYAGPVSRAAAFALDAFIAFWVFTLGSAGLAWIGASLGLAIPEPVSPWAGLAAFVLWCFLYWWVGLALTGRTIGKGVLGLRVLQHDGDPITGMEAALRTVFLPLSFLLLGIGVIVVLISPRRRTLHDVVARTAEVYDWGDRAAELPAPVTAWIARQAGVEIDADTTIQSADDAPGQ